MKHLLPFREHHSADREKAAKGMLRNQGSKFDVPGEFRSRFFFKHNGTYSLWKSKEAIAKLGVAVFHIFLLPFQIILLCFNLYYACG